MTVTPSIADIPHTPPAPASGDTEKAVKRFGALANRVGDTRTISYPCDTTPTAGVCGAVVILAFCVTCDL